MQHSCLSRRYVSNLLFKDSNEHNPEVAQETKCSVIEGITKDPQNEVYDIATFSNEAPVCAEAPGAPSYFSLHQDSDEDSLRRILARPIIVDAGDLNQVPGRQYIRVFQSTASFRNFFGDRQWDRIIGYLGLRFTMKITVIISKTAFHQGVLSVNWQYGVGSDNKSRGNDFPLSVHIPHVRLNMAEATMMELSVPYVHGEEYIQMRPDATMELPYGTLTIQNLTGCPVVSGQSTPRYTVYASMEDVEFIGHLPFTTTTVITQTGISRGASQGHVVNRTTRPSRVREEAQASGLLSGAVEGLADVAEAVGHVPGLSTLGGATDWLLRSTAGAMEAFGFSKPLDETHPQRMVRNTYAGDGHTDIPNVGYSLAPFQSNKLAIDGSVGCNEQDEMALDYVLSKFSYIYRGRITTTTAVNDTVYTCPVTTSAFWYRDKTLSVVGATGNIPLKTSGTLLENAFYPSTLCYVGDNFRYWRGNLRFRVTFANTKLHGGRVAFFFVPGQYEVLAPNVPLTTTRIVPDGSALGPVMTGESLLFDLQDGSTFEFVVPFTYPKAYCNTQTGHIGDVSMKVVSPLTANSVVPSFVDFMVEVAAEPGFEGQWRSLNGHT